ncbi:cysteine desulfurase [Planctomyces bekefii]|uniref:Cysteine desulfurase n=1 Tax=Planctomyces bekefii TaxID=1653850 RepID=A0A5C6M3D2_9PLAN|nr:cysteine desulfurase [Planctomyces bekefii]
MKPWTQEDIEIIRQDFPALKQLARGKPLVYLDSGATALKPKVVVDAEVEHLLYGASNVHRGVHFLSEQATRKFEDSREKARAFLNARETSEIIFTSGTTAGINLVAYSFGSLLKAGDEVLISHMEHHSNIVPWQMLCERQVVVLLVAPIDDRGELIMEEFARLIGPKTRLVAITALSNALGTINPLQEIVRLAHAKDVPVLFDAAQAAPHMALDVQALDVDFLTISSHKLFGPTGVGVLYGKRALLERMPPFLGGGDMIRSVSFERTTYAPLPAKFEAGTPNISGVIAFGVALDYINKLGLARIAAYEHELLDYGTKVLSTVPGLTLVGTARHKASILSFTLDNVHPHDIGTMLDQDGIAIRAGHHCAQPVMSRYGVPATARASLAFYNTKAELDLLAQSLRKCVEVFS